MFLYWLNFGFVCFDHSWNKIFKYWYLKCFILTCKSSTDKTRHFFQITFQADSCFSPFWTHSWKQKVKNILKFPLCQLKQTQIWAISKLWEIIQSEFTRLLSTGKYFLFSLFPVWSPGSGRHSKQMSMISNPTIPGWRFLMHLYQCAVIASGVNFRSNSPFFAE